MCGDWLYSFGGDVKLTTRVLAIFLCLAVVGMMSGYVLAEDKAPATPIILKGAPMGGVKFEHSKHAVKCDTCHHASKAEKPMASAHQKCTDCHTATATAPMKTKLQAAFHNPTAQAGICIDCHKKEAAAGKAAPTKCMQCHQKANG